MIFDPELAAAAKRHARAQAKARQKLTASAVTAAGTGEAAGAAATSTATPSSLSPNSSETNSRATGSSGITSADATTALRVLSQANRDAPATPSLEHESSPAEKAVLGSSGGNRAASGRNSSVGGGLGNGGVGSGRGGGLMSRTASGYTSGDSEGGPRAGPVVSRSRIMKPRLLLKIVVLGSSNVGKTSLMKRYVASDFSENRRPTIGADFMTKEMVAGDQPMLLQIWDTAGQERFHGGSLGSGFFRGANAALLVYDISCAVSFEQVAMWREELLVRLDVDPHDFPIVVIGNKVDLAEDLPMDGINGVNRSRVLKWCEMQGMGHIETSAKEGSGVEVAMQSVAMLALAQKQKRDRDLVLNPSLGGGSILHLADERARQQKERGCCL